MTELLLVTLVAFLVLSTIGLVFWIAKRQQNHEQPAIFHEIKMSLEANSEKLHHFKETLTQEFFNNRTRFDEHLLNSLKLLQESTQGHLTTTTQQLRHTLSQHTDQINTQLQALTQKTERQLQEISQRVDQKLQEGFAKTTETFQKIGERLVIIDQAQQKLTQLSQDMISLQEILDDKKARGSFGEVQLSALINNLLPQHCVSYQHQLSNGKRVDCLLKLPEPTGNVAIDSKFPLESYQQLQRNDLSEGDKKVYHQQFKQDVRKHIGDIADKYIVPGETADGAILFIPAESIFASIHAHYPELIELAQRRRVWLVSPTTLMAVLNTARSVLKDYAAQAQVHIIRTHLGELAVEFQRFQKRMDNLQRHIEQAQADVTEVNTTAKKISRRFGEIDSLQLNDQTNKKLDVEN